MPHLIPAFSATRWLFRAVLLALLVVFLYHYGDLALMRALHASATAIRFDIFNAIDELGASELYLIPALLMYVWALLALKHGWRMPRGWDARHLARAGLFVLLTMALGGLMTWLLKNGVARARPELFIEQGIYGLGAPFARVPEFNSFPSSHTQAAFAAAATLAILLPRARVAFFVIAAAVAAARVVNLDHYLSDVLTAIFLALVSASLLAPLILDPRAAWPLRAPWRWFSGARAIAVPAKRL